VGDKSGDEHGDSSREVVGSTVGDDCDDGSDDSSGYASDDDSDYAESDAVDDEDVTLGWSNVGGAAYDVQVIPRAEVRGLYKDKRRGPQQRPPRYTTLSAFECTAEGGFAMYLEHAVPHQNLVSNGGTGEGCYRMMYEYKLPRWHRNHTPLSPADKRKITRPHTPAALAFVKQLKVTNSDWRASRAVIEAAADHAMVPLDDHSLRPPRVTCTYVS
jgi:hypothetical protein